MASSGATRAPARTLSASAVMLCMIDAQRSVERREAELARVRIERPQAFDLRVSQKVPDIIAQIPARDRLPADVVGIVRRGDFVGVPSAGVARALQRLGVLGADRV